METMSFTLDDGSTVFGVASRLTRLIKAVRAWAAKRRGSEDGAVDIVAVISAALYAVIGPHRIVAYGRTNCYEPEIAAVSAALYTIIGPHRIVSAGLDQEIAAISAAIGAVMDRPHRIAHVGLADDTSL